METFTGTDTRNDIGETPEQAADLDAREIAAIRRLLQNPNLTANQRHAAEQGALWHGITDRPVWADDTDEGATSPTAVRTVEGGKPTITVTFPGWPTQTVSGARAGRAACVLIVDETGAPPKVMCRADFAAARVEADRMTRGGLSSTRFGAVTMPPQPTVAIPVTDA